MARYAAATQGSATIMMNLWQCWSHGKFGLIRDPCHCHVYMAMVLFLPVAFLGTDLYKRVSQLDVRHDFLVSRSSHGLLHFEWLFIVPAFRNQRSPCAGGHRVRLSICFPLNLCSMEHMQRSFFVNRTSMSTYMFLFAWLPLTLFLNKSSDHRVMRFASLKLEGWLCRVAC